MLMVLDVCSIEKWTTADKYDGVALLCFVLHSSLLEIKMCLAYMWGASFRDIRPRGLALCCCAQLELAGPVKKETELASQ